MSMRMVASRFPTRRNNWRISGGRRSRAILDGMAGESNDATPPGQPPVTRLLQAMSEGEDSAAGQLLPLIYDQLLGIARRRMSAERHEHTLQATALVHEAYLRLLGDDGAALAWSSRAH